jgi:hypothetical protein
MISWYPDIFVVRIYYSSFSHLNLRMMAWMLLLRPRRRPLPRRLLTDKPRTSSINTLMFFQERSTRTFLRLLNAFQKSFATVPMAERLSVVDANQYRILAIVIFLYTRSPPERFPRIMIILIMESTPPIDPVSSSNDLYSVIRSRWRQLLSWLEQAIEISVPWRTSSPILREWPVQAAK